MSDRPRTDALFERCKSKSNIECMAELEKLCSTIEGELAQSKDANARLMSACDYLERELEEVTKQRDELAKALKSLCRAIISEEQHGITGLLKRSEAFLSAVKGGQHE